MKQFLFSGLENTDAIISNILSFLNLLDLADFSLVNKKCLRSARNPLLWKDMVKIWYPEFCKSTENTDFLILFKTVFEKFGKTFCRPLCSRGFSFRNKNYNCLRKISDSDCIETAVWRICYSFESVKKSVRYWEVSICFKDSEKLISHFENPNLQFGILSKEKLTTNFIETNKRLIPFEGLSCFNIKAPNEIELMKYLEGCKVETDVFKSSCIVGNDSNLVLGFSLGINKKKVFHRCFINGEVVCEYFVSKSPQFFPYVCSKNHKTQLEYIRIKKRMFHSYKS